MQVGKPLPFADVPMGQSMHSTPSPVSFMYFPGALLNIMDFVARGKILDKEARCMTFWLTICRMWVTLAQSDNVRVHTVYSVPAHSRGRKSKFHSDYFVQERR